MRNPLAYDVVWKWDAEHGDWYPLALKGRTPKEVYRMNVEAGNEVRLGRRSIGPPEGPPRA